MARRAGSTKSPRNWAFPKARFPNGQSARNSPAKLASMIVARIDRSTKPTRFPFSALGWKRGNEWKPNRKPSRFPLREIGNQRFGSRETRWRRRRLFGFAVVWPRDKLRREPRSVRVVAGGVLSLLYLLNVQPWGGWGVAEVINLFRPSAGSGSQNLRPSPATGFFKHLSVSTRRNDHRGLSRRGLMRTETAQSERKKGDTKGTPQLF